MNVPTIILGGGRGTRLYPLTKDRAKPSVPIAGKFRLIDIAMSNCIHSGLEEIYILTQFNSASLNRHIAQTYHFDGFSSRSVRLLAAQQTLSNNDWYQGTADAVRQNLSYLVDSGRQPEHVLILSGDCLYRMDYRQMIERHLITGADITVGAVPVCREQTSELGILKLNAEGQISCFAEKPQTEEELANLSVNGSEPDLKPFFASMGIYVFKIEVLVEKLEDMTNVDFGKDILPKSIYENEVYAYPFDGYWRDIGTIGLFYCANLELLETQPRFDFYDESQPVYTYRHHLPSAKVNQSHVFSCMVADGAIVDGSELGRSIVGLRSIIRTNTKIESSIIMGADYYESAQQIDQNKQRGVPAIGIGNGCLIRQTIVDKNARIGDEVILINKDVIDHVDAENYFIRDYLIIIPKNAVIPSGTVI